MTGISDGNYANAENYILLACAIAKTRSKSYNKAYRNYLANPDEKTLSTLKYCERKLRKPPTCLETGEIMKLQELVKKEIERAETV